VSTDERNSGRGHAVLLSEVRLHPLIAYYSCTSSALPQPSIRALQQLRNIGQRMAAASPAELAVGNMVRRVLHIVRLEYAHALQESTAVGEGEDVGEGGLKSPSSATPFGIKVWPHRCEARACAGSVGDCRLTSPAITPCSTSHTVHHGRWRVGLAVGISRVVPTVLLHCPVGAGWYAAQPVSAQRVGQCDICAGRLQCRL
jgi:hypothetical protein